MFSQSNYDLVLHTPSNRNLILKTSTLGTGKIGLYTKSPEFYFDLKRTGRDLFRLGNGANSLSIDVAAGTGLANITAEAKQVLNGGNYSYKYMGTRGASRLAMNDSEMIMYVGDLANGVVDHDVDWQAAVVARGRGINRVGLFRSPSFDLDVNAGGSNALRLGSGSGFHFDLSAGAGLANIVAGAYHAGGASYKYGSTRGASRVRFHDGSMSFYMGATAGEIHSTVAWKMAMHINEEGQVGIGTTNFPDDAEYVFAADGKGLFEEVRVQLSDNWPDYVFESDYDLMSLSDIKTFINREGHLPNMPSADEVYAEGVESAQWMQSC